VQDSIGATRSVSEPRRQILKRLAYVAPVILTLTAQPAFAATGSSRIRPSPWPGGTLTPDDATQA
jgi:hypothetical protein